MAKKKKKKTKISQWIFRLIFLLGFLILMYPVVSDLYYRVDSNEQITDFDNEKSKLSEEEINERMGLARAYNDSLVNNVTEDPYDKQRLEKGRAEYARMLELHEKIGHVEIPKINQDLPIYAGTTDEVLQKGVGHLEGTSLPIGGNSTHTVLTAHTGLPEARLFTDLTKMEVGDKFYIHNLGETIAYQVDQIKVVLPSEFEDLLVVPGHDYATLLTCTPIMINSHRLLVRGHRVEYVPAVEEALIRENEANFFYQRLFYAALAVIAILLFWIMKLRKRKKKTEAQLKKLKLEQKAMEEALMANEGKENTDEEAKE